MLPIISSLPSTGFIFFMDSIFYLIMIKDSSQRFHQTVVFPFVSADFPYLFTPEKELAILSAPN